MNVQTTQSINPAEYVPLPQFEKLQAEHKEALFYLGALWALIEDHLKDKQPNA